MGYGDTTLILPTLNEGETVPVLINRILHDYDGIRILVIDDGSSDGTIGAVRRFAKSGSVRLIERGRSGLSPGLTASILDGIRRCNTRFVIVMDADMQHPPEKVKEIHSALLKGCQIVVAVRKRVLRWPLHRKLVSKLLSSTGYIVLRVGRKKVTSDIFSGFFGMERGTATRIISSNKRRFVGEGYKVLFDMLKCIDADDKIRICEVPYDFGNRRFGESKAGAMQAIALLKSFFT